MSARPAESTGKVLIADDDAGILLVVEAVLSEAGFEVQTVTDGAQALERCRQWRPDCLVTDIMMPNLDGFELARHVRAEPWGERIQILVMTSLDDVESIRRAYQAGATDFAAKGLKPAILVERIRFLVRALRTQNALRDSESRLAHAQRLAHLGHWERTVDGMTIVVSPVVNQLLGLTAGVVPQWEDLVLRTHPEDYPALALLVDRAIAAGGGYSLDHRILGDDGEMRIVHHEGAVLASTEEGPARIVSILQDVTERRSQEERIRYLDHFDSLTSLPNRGYCRNLLSEAIAASEPGDLVAVLAVDIDGFHRINDSLGQELGDAVLRLVGERLSQELRGSDTIVRRLSAESRIASQTVGRLGGDEFVCIVTKLRQRKEIVAIAQRLQACVARPMRLENRDVELACTIGISVAPEDATDPTVLLDHADAAISHGKKTRTPVQFFSTEMNAQASRRLMLESELREALARAELILHYQPRISLETNEVAGVEALVRWQHPRRGLLSPGEFIPVAEECGLIDALGERVLQEAARQAAIWGERFGEHFRVAINVSSAQSGITEGFVTHLLEILNTYGTACRHFELEITESSLLSRIEAVAATLQELKKHDIAVALDDFGTGFSSLSYLSRLPLNCLKIDQSFVREIGRSARSEALIVAILAMARALGLETIAEGVESETQSRFLAQHRCGAVQGYLYSPALGAAQFEAWHARWSAASQAKRA